ncbi:hypothetical protein [Actinoplanes siamensis]|uniref:Major facilitator superfamily (MFS) profile domain-containing protein n=2 Tax=Actinoplanes siamensis TaxID=1223317 RepID=A0A919TLS5_9ACTN|nr:hypothetical protein Asi03nite_42820 [Actinoplanes siamensis]
MDRRPLAIPALRRIWTASLVAAAGGSFSLVAAFAVLALGGAANFVLSTFRNAITQACTDDAMRGRISGAMTVVLVGGPQLANLLHGAIGALAGPRVTIGAGGVLTVVTVAVVLRAVPELRRYAATRTPAAAGSGR